MEKQAGKGFERLMDTNKKADGYSIGFVNKIIFLIF